MIKYLTAKNILQLLLWCSFLGGVGYGLWELYLYFNIESLVYDVRARDMSTSRKACEELAALDPKRVVGPLVNSLPKGDEAAAGLASDYDKTYELLAEITNEPYHEDPDAWRQWLSGPAGQKFLGKSPQ